MTTQYDTQQQQQQQQKEIVESLNLLEKDWKIEPLLKDFMLGKLNDNITDHIITYGDVTFHIPYINKASKYILWKCLWPDCNNCCDRQGRLPLTSDDLITIGKGLKYAKTSEFIKKETITATYKAENVTITTVNLKRAEQETELDDGTRIPCRFLDDAGGCSMHPARPGVCYLYPFATWTQNDKGTARIHATYQFTGDCPGFYLADDTEQMNKEIQEYAAIIQNYNLESARTNRESLSCTSMIT